MSRRRTICIDFRPPLWRKLTGPQRWLLRELGKSDGPYMPTKREVKTAKILADRHGLARAVDDHCFEATKKGAALLDSYQKMQRSGDIMMETLLSDTPSPGTGRAER